MVILSFLVFVFSYLAAGTTGSLRYGDAISLAQVADKGVFYSLGVATDASGKAVIGGWKSDTISRLSQSPNTMLYIQPAQEATRWGPSDVTVKYGDLVRLEFAGLAPTATPSWLGYDFSSSADTAPAQIIPQTTNFSQNPNLGITFKIVRAKNFDATNDGTANSIVATGDQIALWALVTPSGATSAKQMVLNFQPSTTAPDTGTFFCSAYPSSTTVNNYIFSIPSQHIQAQVINLANANTLPANVLAPAQNVNDWQKTTPTTNGLVTPPPPPPTLKYGDAIVLQHNTYGFYLAMSSNWGLNTARLLTCGLKTLPTNTSAQFFVEVAPQADGLFRNAGQPVKSGDAIRLESVFGQNVTNGYSRQPGWFLNFYMAGPDSATVSTPTSNSGTSATYYNPSFVYAREVQLDSTCGKLCGYRIYKIGGNIGDIINAQDKIYIISWWSYANQYNTQGVPIYLGSTNKVQNDGNIEVFAYASNTQNFVPPNFSQNYYWKIASIIPAAYLLARKDIALGQDWGGADNLSCWPPASTFQWAAGYPS